MATLSALVQGFGRPSQATNETKSLVAQARRQGTSPTFLADQYGVHRATIYRWAAQGRKLTAGRKAT